MRQFYLVNEIGQKYLLNSLDNGFASEPDGLGYSIESGYTKIGTSWARTKFKDEQAEISMKVLFGTASPYEAAERFFNWVRGSSDFTLHRITSAGEWLKDVDIVSVNVTEIEKGNILSVPLKLKARSLWYKAVDSVYQATPVLTGAQRYPQIYPARYYDYAIGNLSIENDGSVPAPMKIVVNGPIVNPVIKLKVNGTEMYRVEISAQAASGETIEWSSRDGNIFCEKVASGVRTNLVGGFDIENANFFKAPVGVSELEFTADAALTAPVTVTLYKQYRAV